MSNESGNTVELYQYDVYGTVKISTPTWYPLTKSQFGNRFLFTGREFDAETGLYNYRARVYNPALGRFLQTDPIGYGDGMGWYAYCGNNPVVFIDPWGLCGQSFWQAQGQLGMGYLEGLGRSVTGIKDGIDAAGGTAYNLIFAHDQSRIDTLRGVGNGIRNIPSGIANWGRNIYHNYDVGNAREFGRDFGEIGGNIGLAILGSGLGSGSRAKIVGTTERLQVHVSNAVKTVDSQGMAAFSKAQQAAMTANPRLAPMFRGSQIDKIARGMVKNDSSLDFLKGSVNNGPDFINPSTGEWWDMTTNRQWQNHVNRYGSNGNHLITDP